MFYPKIQIGVGHDTFIMLFIIFNQNTLDLNIAENNFKENISLILPLKEISQRFPYASATNKALQKALLAGLLVI